jgi:dipeptide/tripeptide permease
MTTTGYATSFFIPTILTQFGWLGQSAQLHTIPVYGVGFVLTLACAWFSDRLQHRYLFTIGGLSLACVGYIVLLCQNDIKAADAMPIGVRYAMIFFITSGNYIAQPLAVVWLANNMGGHYKRSFGAAIQIGVGNIGGIVGSNIFLAAEAPYYKTGYGTGLGLLLFGMCMCSVFYFGMMWENKKRDRGERDHRFNLPKDQLENVSTHDAKVQSSFLETLFLYFYKVHPLIDIPSSLAMTTRNSGSTVNHIACQYKTEI